MTSSTPRWQQQPEDFWQLLRKVCDDDAQADDLTRLESHLQASDAARELYLAYLAIHANLQWRFREEPAEAGIRGQRSGVSGAEAKSEIRSSKSEISNQPSAFGLQPSKSPVLGFLGHTSAVLSKPVLWSILGAGVAFFIYVTAVTWGIRDRAPHDPRLTASTHDGVELVATITDSSDAQWSSDPSSPLAPGGRGAGGEGAAVTLGEPLQITSGIVELKLNQGATLLVEGPASWSIDGENRATLKHGKLVAKVPQQAIGFTLDTPTARIVDLGTEFSADVRNDQDTHVRVLKGEVLVSSVGTAAHVTANAQSRRLVAGQSARITAGSGDVSVSGTSNDSKPVAAPAPRKHYRTLKLDLAKTGKVFDPAPGFPPENAIDDNLDTFSHGGAINGVATWRVDIGEVRLLAAIVLLNRRDVAGGRLRDLTVTVFDADGTTELYRSKLLNSANGLGAGPDEFDGGPDQIIVDLLRECGAPVPGRFVQVTRNSCTNGPRPGDNDVLSLGECQVFEGVEIPNHPTKKEQP